MTKEYHPHIKVNVTHGEKNQIEKLAKQHNMSTSAFVKHHISSILHSDDEVNVPFNYVAESRNLCIKVPVSQRESDTIKEKAGEKTIASYVRDAALNGSKVINVEVYDNDIVDLIHTIQPKIDRILGITKALQMQSQFHDSQYLRLEELLNSIYKDLRTTVCELRKERNSIRQTRLRELRRRCNIAIKTDNDSLAHFAEDIEDEDNANYFE